MSNSWMASWDVFISGIVGDICLRYITCQPGPLILVIIVWGSFLGSLQPLSISRTPALLLGLCKVRLLTLGNYSSKMTVESKHLLGIHFKQFKFWRIFWRVRKMLISHSTRKKLVAFLFIISFSKVRKIFILTKFIQSKVGKGNNWVNVEITYFMIVSLFQLLSRVWLLRSHDNPPQVPCHGKQKSITPSVVSDYLQQKLWVTNLLQHRIQFLLINSMQSTSQAS